MSVQILNRQTVHEFKWGTAATSGMVRRRQVLSALGASTLLTSVETVSSRRGNRPATAREVGIGDEVTECLATGEIADAEELLTNSRVRHRIRGRSLEEELGSPGDRVTGGIGIESRYSESESSVYCSLVHMEDDRWMASGVAVLRDRRYRLRDAAMVLDACAISYDNSEWTSPNPTADNLGLTASHHTIRYEDYSPTYGAAASVELTYNAYPDAVIGMQTELIRRSRHPHAPVVFEYEHTYALTNDYLELVSISVGRGGLSVSLPRGAERAWLHEIATWPSPGPDG